MFKNYLIVALRNLSKNKIYLLINISGMGIAMACCMTAYLLVAFNLEFDDYFEDAEVKNVVKVMRHYRSSTGERDRELLTPIVMGTEVAQELAGIEDYTRITNLNGTIAYAEKGFHENIIKVMLLAF